MGGVGKTFLQANMGGALIHGRSGRNIPTSEHGRSIATWEEHCYMGGCSLVETFLQANMGGSIATWEVLWEKCSSHVLL